MNNFRIYLQQANAPMQVFVLIAVTLFAGGVAGYLALLMAQAFWGLDAEALQALLGTPDLAASAMILKLLQFFNALGMFLLPAMIFSQLISSQPHSYLRISTWPKWHVAALIVVLFVAVSPITDALSWLNNSLALPSFLADFEREMRAAKTASEAMIGNLVVMNNWREFLVNILVLALMPALAEEFFFRGILQRILVDKTGRIHLSVWVTAFAFALMHMQFFAILPLAILGALLGYLKEWTGSLWASILGHFVNNALIVVMLFFTDFNMAESAQPESPEWLWLAASVAVCAAIVYYLNKTKIAKGLPFFNPQMPETEKHDAN